MIKNIIEEDAKKIIAHIVEQNKFIGVGGTENKKEEWIETINNAILKGNENSFCCELYVLNYFLNKHNLKLIKPDKNEFDFSFAIEFVKVKLGKKPKPVKIYDDFCGKNEDGRHFKSFKRFFLLKDIAPDKTNKKESSDDKYPQQTFAFLNENGFSVVYSKFEDNLIKKDSDDMKNKKEEVSLNKIFYGPPGTGKTYNTINAAMDIIEPDNEEKQSRQDLKKKFDENMEKGRIGFVTFHQSFSYEDFVEGLRAKAVDGKIHYDIEDGIFKQLCNNAKEDKVKNYVLIIDEINRGNTANIFGELITLIEPSKREGADEALSLKLPYSKERFSVPDNLYIIGTMNTADRSLALIDTALRRRFQFKEMLPKPDLLKEKTVDGVNIKQLLTVINQRISLLYDREHTIGHSFFLPPNKLSTIDDLKTIFDRQILPLLEEYFFEDWEKIRQVLGDNFKDKKLQIIMPEIKEDEVNKLLGNDYNSNMINSLYSRNDKALSNPDAYIEIYKDRDK